MVVKIIIVAGRLYSENHSAFTFYQECGDSGLVQNTCTCQTTQ